MKERTGVFFTTKGFRYRGTLIKETETHYSISDFHSGKTIELLKAAVETIVWEGDDG